MASKQYSVSKLRQLYLDGFTYEEIAEIMDTTVNTTSYRIKLMKQADPSIPARGRLNEAHTLKGAEDAARRNARLLSNWRASDDQ